MEIAIRVFIIMFVAVAVAGVVIMFAQETFSQSRQELEFDEDQDRKKVLRTNGITNAQLRGLVEECAGMAKGTRSVECFVVKSNSPVGDISLQDSVEDIVVRNQASSDATTLFISYSLGQHAVIVENA